MSINLSQVSTSEYLASDDYLVGTVLPIVTIDRVSESDVPIPNSTKKAKKVVLWFKGAQKGYVLNKQVGRAMGKIFGATNGIDKAWLGCKVQLVVVGDVRRPDGTKGNAFRLKAAWKADAPAETTNPPAADTPAATNASDAGEVKP